MILNLGCGGITRLHTKIEGRNIINYDIEKNEVWLDVMGDAHCLPFHDDAFSITLAYHVLEHCYNPHLVLKDVARVTESCVIIKVPNSQHYNFFNEDSGHIYSWNSATLRNICKMVWEDVEIVPSWVLRAKDYPRKIQNLLLILVNKKQTELTAICRKKR